MKDETDIKKLKTESTVDTIERCISNMKCEFADILIKSLDINSELGQELLAIAYPDNESPDILEIPVEAKVAISGYLNRGEEHHILYQAIACLKDTEISLFPFDIGITIYGYSTNIREVELLRKKYDELSTRFEEVLPDAVIEEGHYFALLEEQDNLNFFFNIIEELIELRKKRGWRIEEREKFTHTIPAIEHALDEFENLIGYICEVQNECSH